MSNEAISGTFTIADELYGMRPQATFSEKIRRIGKTALGNPLGTIGLLLIATFTLAAIFAPWITQYGPKDFPGTPDQGLSSEFWFGTDRLGHDIFSRTVYGARVSLSVAFFSVVVGGAIGILLGIISGYVGGTLDSVFQRTVDTLIAFPVLLLLLIITQSDIFAAPSRALGINEDYGTIIFALTLAVIPGTTRIVRGAVLAEKQNQYIEAARAIGAWSPRIILRHVLPNVVALGIVIMTTLLGGIILAEASLAFLGLGIPDTASWGSDVSKARDSLPYHIPAAFFPGAAITLTVLGFNLLGDAIRDIADPRLRGSR
jgi:peptide/nickel transport system permease protein